MIAMQDLRLTLIQADIFWEDTEANLDRFGHLIRRINGPTDLILLPETFNTGFSINPAICAEDIHGRSMQFLRRMAAEQDAAIMATLLIREDNNHYNRLVCMYSDGHFETYNKRHLFRLSDEFRLFSQGDTRRVFEVKGWKIFPQICYDLRFPVWSRNGYSKGEYSYDLLIYLANWPASRAQVWKTLLPARAIENQSYVAGVNRIGRDGHETNHVGDSMVADAKGNLLYIAGAASEEIRTLTLSATDLRLFRDAFTVGMDWDSFTINLKKQP
jgi:predicted amidohydrolase